MELTEDLRRDNTNAVLHLGLHRTATTTLQRQVFNQLPGVHYVHKPRPAQWRSLQRPAQPLLISSEGALVRGWSGDWRSGWAQELAERFPDAQPLLTLRRHDRWLLSQYSYRVFKGEPRSFQAFVNERASLYYMDCVRQIESLFGTPPALLFHEEINDNFPESVALIARLCGAPSVPGIAPRQRNARQRWPLTWAQRLNRKFPPSAETKPRARKLRRKSRELATLSMSLAESRHQTDTGHNDVDPDQIEAVRHAYQDDWLAILRVAAEQRPLLSSRLEQELDTGTQRVA